MKLEQIIQIPKKQKRNYISALELILSLASGVAMISLNRIYSYSQENYTSLFIPLIIMILTKLIITINFCIRYRKEPSSALQYMSKISISELFIPSIIKTMFYISWVIAALSIKRIPIIVTIIVNLFLNEYMTLRLKYNRKIDCLSILSCILLSGSLLCMVDQFTMVWKVHTIILVLLMGTILPISFFYLHREIFHIYKPQIDELIAKQHFIELVNYLIIFTILAIGTKQDFLSSLQTLFNTPFQLFICSITSILYEYVLFQMLSKVQYKFIFLSQTSGIVWVAIYLAISQGMNLKIYISMFLGILSLFLILHIVTIKKIDKCLMKWNRKQNQT